VGGVVSAYGPQPGDALNWTIAFPQWWHGIKAQYELREVRKCEFLEFVPNTGDHCPGVSRKDHYYCIYGNETQATWFCTCIEKTGEFVFHCDTELRTTQDIVALELGSTASDPPQQPSNPPSNATVSAQQPINPPTNAPLTSQTGGSAVSTGGPQPGDEIDWTIDFPQWWHDIKAQYELREVRK